MKKLIGALGSLFLLLSACMQEPSTGLSQSRTYRQSFEPNQFWINMNTTKAVPDAHSGSYAALLDSSVEYGPGLEERLGDLATTAPKEVTIKAWLKLKTPPQKLTLVVAVDDVPNQESRFWSGTPINKIMQQPDVWKELSITIPLKGSFNSNDHLKVYFWNQAREKVLIDDFSVSLK